MWEKNPTGLKQNKGHRQEYFTPKEIKCPFQYSLLTTGLQHQGDFQPSATRILGAGRAEHTVPAQELTAWLKLDPAICVITKQLVNASGNSGHSPMLLNMFVAG